MQELTITEVEARGARVLTSKQIADLYGTTAERIKQNFQANRERYIAGKHYISLTGEELREFKHRGGNSALVSNRANILFLWTEKGALLHAKSLNTDKAWEVYDYLVDFYFRAKETVPAAQEQKPSGRLVVDVPENIEIQKGISDVRKYMNAVDTILDEYNTYHCEGNYRHYYMVLNNLSVTLIKKMLDLLEIKPNMVRKHC